MLVSRRDSVCGDHGSAIVGLERSEPRVVVRCRCRSCTYFDALPLRCVHLKLFRGPGYLGYRSVGLVGQSVKSAELVLKRS